MTTTVRYIAGDPGTNQCAMCHRTSCIESGYFLITVDGKATMVGGGQCFEAVIQPTCPKCNSTCVGLVGFNANYHSYECESCFIWFKHGIRDGVVFNEHGGHMVMNDLHPDMDH